MSEREANEVIEFRVTNIAGNVRGYKARSLEDLRMQLAIEAGVLSPCMVLFKQSDHTVVPEQAEDVGELFGIDAREPHELYSVNNEEAVKQEVRDRWSAKKWIDTVECHVRHGDENVVERARELALMDTRFRDKMHTWVRTVIDEAWSFAALEEHAEDIKVACALGVNVVETPACMDFAGRTLLHRAAKHGHMGLLHTLLHDVEVAGEVNATVDVNVREVDGQTPLYWAAQEGHVDAVRALLDAHADPSLEDTSDGMPPLHIAVTFGRAQVTY